MLNMLNTIIFYQNVSCVSGIENLASKRKKSEIIEAYSVILDYTRTVPDVRRQSVIQQNKMMCVCVHVG